MVWYYLYFTYQKDIMKNHPRQLVALLAATALLTLGACSSGGASSAPTDAPSVSTTEESVAPATKFDTAAEFAQVFTDGNVAGANRFVSPDSAAERYLVHQLNVEKVQKADGQFTPSEFDLDVDKEAEQVTITSDEASFTWSKFTYDAAGKVTGWSTDNGTLKKSLWSKTSKTQKFGAKLELKSAAVTSTGEDLIVVVDLSSRRKIGLGYDVIYTGKDKKIGRGDYGQSSGMSTGDVYPGEKISIYYVIPKAKIGGKLKLMFFEDKTSEIRTITINVR